MAKKNPHPGPPRVVPEAGPEAGIGVQLTLMLWPPAGLSSQLARPAPQAKFISIICPQDGEGFYGPSESNLRKEQALLAKCMLILRSLLLNSGLVAGCRTPVGRS